MMKMEMTRVEVVDLGEGEEDLEEEAEVLVSWSREGRSR